MLLEPRYPLRGEIWWTSFPADPPDKGRRPVVIVSADGRNSHPRSTTVLAIPLSTSLHKPRPANLLLRSGETGLRDDSVAQADNICVVRKTDLEAPAGEHRRLTHSQVCKLAVLVRLAMGCVE